MQWQYLVLRVSSGLLESDEPLEMRAQWASVGSDMLQPALNQLGGQGWEAFSSTFDSKGAIVQVLMRKQK